MKSNDRQELKPVYIHEACFTADDEISLIDLVMVLIRRKVMIITIIIISFALGVTITLLTPKTYTFSTTIEVGSQIIGGSIQPFESPQALVAKLQYSYIPETLIKHKQTSQEDRKNYRIKASVPKGGNIVLLEVEGIEEQAHTLTSLLQSISQKAIQDHSRIFTSVKSGFEARLNQARNNLSLFKNKSDNNNKLIIVTNQSIIEKLESQLTNLRNTREILPPVQSINPTGGSRKINIIIFTLAGIFLGVFAAFFAEFLSKVKQKVAEKDKT